MTEQNTPPIAMHEKIRPNADRIFRMITKSAPTVLVFSAMAVGWFALHRFNEGGSEPEEPIENALSDVLVLPTAKLDAAKLKTEPAQTQSIQSVQTLPGRIRYNESKHIDIKAPMDGTLTEVLGMPGQQVKQGELIAVLRSAEIGQARAMIVKLEKQREIAARILQRETSIAKNLNLLTSMLNEGESPQAIEDSLNNLELGSHRQDILSTYAKMRLSAELLGKIRPLASSGSIAGRVFRERETESQLSETAFRTAKDQAKYLAEQAKLKAEAELAEAERQCDLARKSVEQLLGYRETLASVDQDSEEQLSRLELRAPIDGTLESRAFSNNERVSKGESLFVLANTDLLCVSASIRESEWAAVSLQPGTTLSVFIPALNNREFQAKVQYVGREVLAETNSIPLVATLENCNDLLRPGMFVRVTVPMGPTRHGLSVKSESVVHHENQPFVFVDMKGEGFKKVDVSIGHSSEDWVEVTKGLELGQLVVTDGAFLLKSEYLLRGEAE